MKKSLAVVVLVLFIGFVAYEALIYYDDNFRYGRMRETPAVKPHEKEMPVMAEGVIPLAGGEAIYRIAKGEDLVSPVKKGDHTGMEMGRALYLTYCVHCHGKNFDGNGPVGQSFYPLPGDLRSEKVQSMAEGVIFKEISYGVPKGRQPPLATTIDIRDRWRIVAYLKSLGPRP